MKDKRGIGLVLALVVAALMAMLVVAMVVLNRDGLTLLKNERDREAAYQGCVSGLDYVRQRLRDDSTWASSALSGPTVVVSAPGLLEITESGATLNDNLVEGVLSTDTTFEVRVLNNLAAMAPAAAPAWSRTGLDVPAHSVLVSIVGRTNRSERRLETILTRRSFAAGQLTANGDLGVSLAAGQLQFSADDPTRNGLRSKGLAVIPDSNDLTFGPNPGDGTVSGATEVNEGGTVQVDGQGNMTGVTGGTDLGTDPVALSAAEANSNASIQPGRDTPAPSLGSSDVKKSGGVTSTLPAGQYYFTGPNTVAYFSSVTDDPLTASPVTVFSDVIYDGGSTTGTQVAARVRDYRLEVAGDVTVSGDLKLAGAVPPVVALGFESNGSFDTTSTSLSSLSVQGDVTVEGDVTGRGSLIVEAGSGNGDLALAGKSNLSALPDEGVMVYAEGKITVNPVMAGFEARPDAFTQLDFELLPGVVGHPNVEDWSIMNDWLTMDPAAQLQAVGYGDNFDEGISLNRDNLRDIAIPNFVSAVLPSLPGWSGGLTPGGNPLPAEALTFVSSFGASMSLGRYVRLREFLKTVDQGSPDLGWLTMDAFGSPSNQYDVAVGQRVVEMYTRFATEAQDQGMTLEAFFTTADYTGTRDDVWLRGLVFGDSLYAPLGNTLNMVGALATGGGSLVLSNLAGGDLRYDSSLLDLLLEDTAFTYEKVVWVLD